jgi:hypothetical protein
MSAGKSSGQARSDIDTIGSGNAAASRRSEAEAVRTADARTSATRAAEAASSSSLPSRWWIGCGRHARFDQLDPPTVDDPVVGRCRDCHRPAEMMSYAQPHAGGP